MPRTKIVFCLVGVMLFGGASAAEACGGLIGPKGAVNLGRTTTLAAYVGGIEHYVTAFEFSGGGGEFGSIVPLPAIPTKVERGGDWTLQRLVRETSPPRREVAFLAADSAASASPARVVSETRVDALDITVLEGGGDAVGVWAKEHGFLLPPDGPEVLDFYARRSQIFMAAVFNADAARERGQQIGDGTPIHLTIPTSNPWVPLRILGLGKSPQEQVNADVYLLTEKRPVLIPVRTPGVTIERREPASDSLLADLRSDKGMEWLPSAGMWLSYIVIDIPADKLRFDLAADVSGRGRPSWEAYGLSRPTPRLSPQPSPFVQASPTPEPSPPVIAVPPIEHLSSDGSLDLGIIAGGLLASALAALALRRLKAR